MKIYSVQEVRVFRKNESPLELVIAATGLTTTTGWKNPRLDSAGDSNPGDAVIEFSFEADRPTGIVLQVLTPTSATLTVTPAHGADAVVVSSRTNSITVHASEFIPNPSGQATTLAVGEETSATLPIPQAEMNLPTTAAIGEEFTTFMYGEESPTYRFGEHGPFTDPRVDDPIGRFKIPTGPVGEDPGPFRWRWNDPFGGNPFGSF